MKNRYDSYRNRLENDDSSYERKRRDRDFNSDFSGDRSSSSNNYENQNYERNSRNEGWNDPYISNNYNNNTGRRSPMNNDSSVDYQYDRRDYNYGNSNLDNGRYGSNNRNRYDSNYRNEDNNDRTWWDKTTDEVSSWFGDDDAERRRKMDKREGPHKGKGPKGYTRSDDSIKNDVNEALYHETYVDASDIDVSVDNGEVKLSGTVDSKMAKRRAEDCVEDITGVTEVNNELKVKKTTDTNINNMRDVTTNTRSAQQTYETSTNGNKNKNVTA